MCPITAEITTVSPAPGDSQSDVEDRISSGVIQKNMRI